MAIWYVEVAGGYSFRIESALARKHGFCLLNIYTSKESKRDREGEGGGGERENSNATLKNEENNKWTRFCVAFFEKGEMHNVHFVATIGEREKKRKKRECLCVILCYS